MHRNPFIHLSGDVKEKCLSQEHNTMSPAGLEPGMLDPEASALTMRPPGLNFCSVVFWLEIAIITSMNSSASQHVAGFNSRLLIWRKYLTPCVSQLIGTFPTVLIVSAVTNSTNHNDQKPLTKFTTNWKIPITVFKNFKIDLSILQLFSWPCERKLYARSLLENLTARSLRKMN